MVEIWIFLLSIVGFYISWHIFKTKKQSKSLVCRFGEDCNGVVNSKYNTIFGFQNEILGMLYYGFVAILSLTLLSNIPIIWILIVLGILASLFSLYLIYIQAFVLKKWCEYCITSAIITFLILAVELFLL